MEQKNNFTHLQEKIAQLVKERDWEKFHSPKNVSIDIAGEAAELMEHFKWLNDQESFEILNKKRKEIEEEIADVFISALSFCNATHIDPEKVILAKLEEIKAKYPVDQVKGKSLKYTEYKKE